MEKENHHDSCAGWYLFYFRLMMSQQGLNTLFPMEDIAVMGIWELLPHLIKFRV